LKSSPIFGAQPKSLPIFGAQPLAAFALLLISCSALAAPVKSSRIPSDPIVATLPHKSLRASDLQAAWFKLGPQDRPTGTGLALRRALLDDVLTKEALGRAAIKEPFVMTDQESARYQAFERDLLQKALYQKWVLDSLKVNKEDRAHAKARMAAGGADTTDAKAVEANARMDAERRRGDVVGKRIQATLAPVWDDSVVALTARAFDAMPPSNPDLKDPMRPRLPEDIPPIASADSGKVLVRATGETMTVIEFVDRYRVLNPFERKPPRTPGEVKARGEQFLGAAYFLRESTAQGLENTPAVRRALADRRESIALDHFYTRHVVAKIDTSDATLRAVYDRDPTRYAVPAHLVLNGLPTHTQGAADSAVTALAQGTPWDSLCSRAFPDMAATDRPCAAARNVPLAGSDSALVHAFDGANEKKPYVMPLPPQAGGGFLVWRLVERVEARSRGFDEARSYVLRDAANEQSEVLVNALIKDLRAKMPVKVNDAALARVELPTAAGPRP